MNDETDPGFPITVPVKPPASVTTSTITETTETTGVTKPHESTIGGISGRFWIALVAMFGAVAVSIMCLLVDGIDANLMGLVLAGLLPLAGNITGIYMGQAQKPKSQTQ